MSADAFLLSEVHARAARLNAEMTYDPKADPATMIAAYGLDTRSMQRLRAYILIHGSCVTDLSPDKLDAYFDKLEANRKDGDE